ncbi:DDE_3 domain-containing protein [Trichonephila clavipes]|nr:DDE_3 domain-containing protein [Trichonephila clavipes]
MMQTLFPAGDRIFQDDNTPIPAVRLAQSWFDEQENEVKQLPRPVLSPVLNVIEPLLPIIERPIRSPATSLSKHSQYLHE